MAKTNHGDARGRVKSSACRYPSTPNGTKPSPSPSAAAAIPTPLGDPPAYEFQLRPVREFGARRPIGSPEAAYRYWQEVVCAADWYCPAKEHLVVLLLDTRCRLLGHHLVSVGSLTETIGEPRDILAPVLCCAAAGGFLLMHNHPSGDPNPSRSDHRLTGRVKAAAQLLRLPFHDHIIAGAPIPPDDPALDLYETPYYSFADDEEGWAWGMSNGKIE